MAVNEVKTIFNNPLPVHFVGQGTVICNLDMSNDFSICIGLEPKSPECSEKKVDGNIKLSISDGSAVFTLCSSVSSLPLSKTNDGLVAGEKVAYWFSFNRNYPVIKYGKGYIMEETTLMTYEFKSFWELPDTTPDQRKLVNALFNPETHKTIQITASSDPITSCTNGGVADVGKEVAFYPYPLVSNWSPFVLDSSQSSLEELDQNNYILSGSLPAACQELYQNISGENVKLDEKLSKAIAYSLNTKNMILYEKLKEKPEGFQYLRITLGVSRGDSPGIPYVLEIWPQGTHSPIHNHGNAYAVIKVLYGAIDVNIYNKPMQGKTESLKHFSLTEEGQVTWISPNWYQSHQLKNSSQDFCATIQCYQYGKLDRVKWPYFDYVGEIDLEEFRPDSDFDFLYMRNTVLQEYAASHTG